MISQVFARSSGVFSVSAIAGEHTGKISCAINSSAFGPGEYRLRVQGYTWRGQRIDVGWVRLIVR